MVRISSSQSQRDVTPMHRKRTAPARIATTAHWADARRKGAALLFMRSNSQPPNPTRITPLTMTTTPSAFVKEIGSANTIEPARTVTKIPKATNGYADDSGTRDKTKSHKNALSPK